MIIRLIVTIFIGGVGALFVGLGIVCCSMGYGWGCFEFFLWGVIALITAIVLWKKPARLFGWVLPDFVCFSVRT